MGEQDRAEWYCSWDGVRQTGPHSYNEVLAQLAADQGAHECHVVCHVWKRGLREWQPIVSVADFETWVAVDCLQCLAEDTIPTAQDVGESADSMLLPSSPRSSSDDATRQQKPRPPIFHGKPIRLPMHTGVLPEDGFPCQTPKDCQQTEPTLSRRADTPLENGGTGKISLAVYCILVLLFFLGLVILGIIMCNPIYPATDSKGVLLSTTTQIARSLRGE